MIPFSNFLLAFALSEISGSLQDDGLNPTEETAILTDLFLISQISRNAGNRAFVLFTFIELCHSFLPHNTSIWAPRKLRVKGITTVKLQTLLQRSEIYHPFFFILGWCTLRFGNRL